MKGAVSDSVSHVKSLVCFFRQIVGAEKELFTKELFFFPAWKINCNADLLPWNVSLAPFPPGKILVTFPTPAQMSALQITTVIDDACRASPLRWGCAKRLTETMSLAVHRSLSDQDYYLS